MTTRAFRFGIAGGGFYESVNQWRDFVHRVEDLGYSAMVVGDHMGPGLSAMPAMLGTALATRHLRVGSHVLANDFRNPAVLAKEAATIDWMSGGRLELGIGAGYEFRGIAGHRMASDWEQTGIDLLGPGKRLERLAETVTILKMYFESEQPFTFHGAHYHVEGVVPAPRPVQQPHPPIMIGGVGRKILELAAREADIVAFSARPPNGINPISGATGLGLTFAEQVEIVRRTAGPRYAGLELSVFAISPDITTDVEGSTERVAQQMRTSPDVIRESPWALIGSVDGMVERIQRERERYDLSYWIIGGGSIDLFAPIVARLAGR